MSVPISARNPMAAAAVALVAWLFGDRAPADTVYAVSFSDGRIVRFDTSSPISTMVELSAAGALVNPAGLAMGPDGRLYVGEGGNGTTVAPSVRRLDLATNTLSTVHTFGAFDVFPGALAFRGNDLLVGRNPYFGNTGPVVRLADAIGASPTVSDYTTGGSLAGSPGLALGADGSLYVSNHTYNAASGIPSGPVVRFDSTGAYVGEVVAPGTATMLYGPTGLAISGNTLFTASMMLGVILRTDLSTGVTETFASTRQPMGAGTLAVLSDGGLIVGNPDSGGIYRFNAAGAMVVAFDSGLGAVGGLVVVPAPGTVVLLGIGLAGLGRRRRA